MSSVNVAPFEGEPSGQTFGRGQQQQGFGAQSRQSRVGQYQAYEPFPGYAASNVGGASMGRASFAAPAFGSRSGVRSPWVGTQPPLSQKNQRSLEPIPQEFSAQRFRQLARQSGSAQQQQQQVLPPIQQQVQPQPQFQAQPQQQQNFGGSQGSRVSQGSRTSQGSQSSFGGSQGSRTSQGSQSSFGGSQGSRASQLSQASLQSQNLASLAQPYEDVAMETLNEEPYGEQGLGEDIYGSASNVPGNAYGGGGVAQTAPFASNRQYARQIPRQTMGGYAGNRRPSFGSNPGYGSNRQASVGSNPGYAGNRRPSFGGNQGYGSNRRESFGSNQGYAGNRRPSFGANTGYPGQRTNSMGQRNTQGMGYRNRNGGSMFNQFTSGVGQGLQDSFGQKFQGDYY